VLTPLDRAAQLIHPAPSDQEGNGEQPQADEEYAHEPALCIWVQEPQGC
jgi:hypothetical protein